MRPAERKLFALAAIFILILSLPLLFIYRGEMVILLQTCHHPLLDYTFARITRLGNGVIFVPVIIMLSAYHYKYAIMGIGVALLHALICAVLKQVILPDMLRPAAYLESHQIILKEIRGITLYKHHAFPSGHTATAFALAFFLFITIRKNWTILLFPLAVLVGISRIYIGQHFYADVVAGALVGCLSVFIICRIAYAVNWPEWAQRGWLGHRFATSPD